MNRFLTLAHGVVAVTFFVSTPHVAAQGNPAAPRFEYVHELGCGDLGFHARSSSSTEFLRIEVDFPRLGAAYRDELRNPPAPAQRTFDLADAPVGIAVDVTVYRQPQPNPPNCSHVFITDTSVPPNPPEVWRAVGGTLTVERGPRGVVPEQPYLSQAGLRLAGAKFEGPDGMVVEMSQPFAWVALVWARYP